MSHLAVQIWEFAKAIKENWEFLFVSCLLLIPDTWERLHGESREATPTKRREKEEFQRREKSKKRRLVAWRCLAAFCFVAACFMAWREQREKREDLIVQVQEQSAKIALLQTRSKQETQQTGSSNLISGTKFTREELQSALPFGYVIVRQDVEMETWQPKVAKRVEWRIDWDKSSITPDFIHHKVVWVIANPSMHVIENGVSLPAMESHNLTIGHDCPLTVGDFYEVKAIAPSGNQPHMFVGTLSDDQRIPIFVVGFRIPEAPTP